LALAAALRTATVLGDRRRADCRSHQPSPGGLCKV